jgi:hypothetical protein
MIMTMRMSLDFVVPLLGKGRTDDESHECPDQQQDLHSDHFLGAMTVSISKPYHDNPWIQISSEVERFLSLDLGDRCMRTDSRESFEM